MRTRLNRLQYFLLLSLLVHLILAFAWTDPALRHLLLLAAPKPVVPPPPPSLALQLEPSSFVPTLPSQAAPQPPPNATLESERNTQLKSTQPSQDRSDLPNMTGSHRGGLVYHDSPNSPEVRSQESEAAPKVAPQTPSPTPPHPPAAKAPAAPDVPPAPDAIPMLPPPNQSKTPPEKEETQLPTPPQPQVTPAVQSPPPSSASFSQQRSEVVGGASAVGDPSPASKETEMGRYKSKLYRMIGSKWYISVERNMTLLAIGEVHVKFFVQANGVISQVSVSSESGRVDILRSISLKAVSDSYGEPFTDNLKQQLGDGYWDDITFTIY